MRINQSALKLGTLRTVSRKTPKFAAKKSLNSNPVKVLLAPYFREPSRPGHKPSRVT